MLERLVKAALNGNYTGVCKINGAFVSLTKRTGSISPFNRNNSIADLQTPVGIPKRIR